LIRRGKLEAGGVVKRRWPEFFTRMIAACESPPDFRLKCSGEIGIINAAGLLVSRARHLTSGKTWANYTMGKIGKGKKMFGSKASKERERYYLLPGQGGHAYRRKQKFILKWAVLAALAVSAVLAAALYWMNHPKP